MDTLVAIKVLQLLGDSDEDQMNAEQFDLEMNTLSKYRHPNILGLIGFSAGPPRCIVSELMSGGSVADRLDEGDLSHKQRVQIALDTVIFC